MNFIPNYKNSFRILKGGKISLVVSSFLASTTLSFAAPSGGVVTSGSANISQNGKVTDITQSTQKASINWNKFNIASDETVNFKQPNSSSITLNRVVGNEKSIINGALNANGQVWIINSNGVLFGKGASINTSGLLATTKDISDADFQAGNYNFKGNSNESVINLGTIDVINSGSVILAANEVRNEGTIKAIRGKIHLAGADEYTVNLNGNSLVNLTVNKGVLDALVKNSGTIISNGGEVYLTTNAVNELLKGVVNNTGIIEANSLDGITGKVELFAHGGTAEISGNINAVDGFVETSGDKVKISDDFRVKADKWLIDPKDFTIAASGGDMTGATLSSNLESADIEIQSVNGATDGAGDIFVNDAISWDAATKLTLNAQNDIFINSAITASNASGQVALYYGQGAVASNNTADYYIKAPINLQAGDNFFTKLGSDGSETIWKVITSLGSAGSTTGTDLQGINGNLLGNYVLGANIDASDTSSWNVGNHDWNTGTAEVAMGWTPIGNSSNRFTGNFDGLGHTISNLKINNKSNFTGLFGNTDGATIKNIGVVDADIQSHYAAGILIGDAKNTTIKKSYTTGKITGTSNEIGGLVGRFASGGGNSYIENSYSSADVTGTDNVGGLVGLLLAGSMGEDATTSISNAYATGNVSGAYNVGGLVGRLSASSSIMGGDATATATATASISNAYATGNVSGTNNVGGLVGDLSASSIMERDATATATATASISNAYATGNVSGANNLGGLVGLLSAVSGDPMMMGDATATSSTMEGDATATASISNAYATGNVSGTGSSLGGLVANIYGGTIENAWYDKETNKGAMTDSATYGKTKAELRDLAAQNWDIETYTATENTYPTLAWEESGNGYTKTWVIGTKVATPDPVDPIPDPVDPKPDPVDPKPEIKKIVDSITNQTATTVNLPNVEANTTPNNIGKNVNIIFVQGENQMLVSRPIEGQSTQRVSLSEARQMQIQNGGSSEEVIVPLSNSSIIQLIDGGVNLPSGVEQEFYLANANTQEEK
ncbi:filamentous hemagglutinin N-terminal domain-containing protein [Aliarcobacter cryaerophilus]|uniref:two-partner secretion domain-containing protein n=1 Tax=Aliarcobacter cryaerophilus TaxID=28198 RepID=UPI0021B6950D|nr:filamentous hemagglutinin N-terminal domain-containing protein [Aliarcobacter cryaerophilus]MCT7529622.1 filamentous hemagglutinin N-terminal domain-containing protein [Aliarcobacter cryaerophilus]